MQASGARIISNQVMLSKRINWSCAKFDIKNLLEKNTMATAQMKFGQAISKINYPLIQWPKKNEHSTDADWDTNNWHSNFVHCSPGWRKHFNKYEFIWSERNELQNSRRNDYLKRSMQERMQCQCMSIPLSVGPFTWVRSIAACSMISLSTMTSVGGDGKLKSSHGKGST